MIDWKTSTTACLACALSLAALEGALAQPMPETTIRVIGGYSTQIQTSRVEKPFWTEEIPRDSNGKIKVTYNAHDLMGIKEQQIIRLSEAGVADVATTDILKLGGDDPVFEGCDLPGTSPDMETTRKACATWSPIMADTMAKKFRTRLLALAPNPGLVFFCRTEMKSLKDLSGRKVRVNSRPLADFVTAFGATAITTPFGEVVPGLQRGVFDCAISGSLSGNTAGWGEVSKFIYPLAVTWALTYHSASIDSWDKWAPPVRDYITGKFKSFEDRLWTMGAQMEQEGIACSAGKDPCTLGRKNAMTITAVDPGDRELVKKVTQEAVLLQWAKRCGKECAARWNDTFGKVVGLSIPLDRI